MRASEEGHAVGTFLLFVGRKRDTGTLSSSAMRSSSEGVNSMSARSAVDSRRHRYCWESPSLRASFRCETPCRVSSALIESLTA